MAEAKRPSLGEMVAQIAEQEADIRLGGGQAAIQRQHKKKRLTARERIEKLIDPDTSLFELNLWAAWQMYANWGGAPAAGVVTGIGTIGGRRHMIIANDATVKAGAFFPATAKKVLRAQRIAMQNRLPLVYLVDSAGVFLPLQEDVFPDEDDFGRIFRNNAVISAAGLGQIAAIMGNCVAGGGYLPGAVRQAADDRRLGLVSGRTGAGEKRHRPGGFQRGTRRGGDARPSSAARSTTAIRTMSRAWNVCANWCPPFGPTIYNHRPLSNAPHPSRRSVKAQSFTIFFRAIRQANTKCARCSTACSMPIALKNTSPSTASRWSAARRGSAAFRSASSPTSTIACGLPTGRFNSAACCTSTAPKRRPAFVMNCNQDWLPIVFLQDVNGFMVGRDSERSGIIKAGAKLVNAISNSRVPKMTVIIGGSYGAGNYALCGKAFDPRFIFAWPSAQIAVMGGEQASDTLLDVAVKSLQREGDKIDAAELEKLRDTVKSDYERQMDVRYTAARGWVDAILDPATTRESLTAALEVATRHAEPEPFRLGVFQV